MEERYFNCVHTLKNFWDLSYDGLPFGLEDKVDLCLGERALVFQDFHKVRVVVPILARTSQEAYALFYAMLAEYKLLGGDSAIPFTDTH